MKNRTLAIVFGLAFGAAILPRSAVAVNCRDFGRMVSTNQVQYAPNFLVLGEGSNEVYVADHACTTNDYWSQCWSSLIDVPPVCETNFYVVATGWKEAGSNYISRVYEIHPVPPPPPRKFSKLKIYGAIISLPEANGVSAWELVKAWLEQKTIEGINGWMAFQLAQEVSEDHPLFVPLAKEAQELLMLTDEQFAALLDACILED